MASTSSARLTQDWTLSNTLLILFTKLLPSYVSFRYGIPFSSHNPKGTDDGKWHFWLQFWLQLQLRLWLQFRLQLIDLFTNVVAATIIPALTPSIDKNNLSSFDLNNNSSISQFVDSVTKPWLVAEVYPSYVLLIDPSVVPSFGLNHDPSSFPSLIFVLVFTDPTL